MEFGKWVLAYGVEGEPGVFTCVDCGYRYRHRTRAPLPPCPRYRDSNHGRAAWTPAESREDRPGAREDHEQR
jgi:hypothetical protein